ncbi:MAG: efflux RND transporter periplasmic adaptor subunit [Bacteroidales bacterium]
MKINIQILFLLGLALASCTPAADKGKEGTGDVLPVKVITLQQQTVFEPVFASGSFTTDDETMRSFKTGGIVQHIYVKEGDAVKSGQLLAILDLTEITAQVAQATLAWEKAQRDFNRLSNLYRDSVVTLEQLQNARTGLDIAKEQLTAAKFNRTFSEIRAGEGGFILRKFVNEGQVVGPGSPVFQTNGAGDGNWILRVAVSDGQWGSLEKGDSASITSDLPGLKSMSGFVNKKSEGVDPVTGTFTIDIKPVRSLGHSVASGMFGKVTITPSHGRKMWLIPYDALLDGDGSKGYVFVTCDKTRAKKIKVSVAGISRDHVLIDGGLEGCSTVIVSGSAYLTDNSLIHITQ